MLRFKARWDRLAVVYLVVAFACMVVGAVAAVPLHGVWFVIGACLLGAFFPLVIVYCLVKGFFGIA